MKNLLIRSLPIFVGFLLTGCLGKIGNPGVAVEAIDASVDTSCIAYTNFTQDQDEVMSIQNRIYQSCQTCHNSSGGQGANMYLIQGPNQTDQQSVANFIEARGRMLFGPEDDISKSDLIQYGRAYKSHTGGAAFTLEDEEALTNWAFDLSECAASESAE